MVNELLINLVSKKLGSGKKTSRGNVAFVCPFHVSNPPGKKNFEINFTENKEGINQWACWGCGKKGKTLKNLFKQIKASSEYFQELKTLSGNLSIEKDDNYENTVVELPKEFLPILNNPSIISKHALKYLKSRNITEDDIIKYNIGYCEKGLYSNMIIIPSYDTDGVLNFFTARSFENNAFIRYRNPNVSRDIIPFELFINWNLPIIICEGFFDAIAIKRNAIPLLGKNIQPNLMKKIITSTVKKIYLALDSDAIKQSLKFAEEFINENKEVYLVELKEKDPSSIGFINFTNIIQSAIPLSQYSLMEKKLSL
jgi:DNA primase